MSAATDDQPYDAVEAEDLPDTMSLAYEIEQVMYGIAIVLGIVSSIYTIRKFRRSYKEHLDVAARLLSYKISLSVADVLILFVYAPTQHIWISTYWVLIAFDGLMTIAHINKVHAKGASDYNTRVCLAIAWLLALLSSTPQLFIFKIVYHNDVDPQCTSIWYEYSQQLIEEEIARIEAANDTIVLDEHFFENSAINEKWLLMQKWEKVYNIVHVSLICVIPYLLELICYALMLAFLTEAEKGEFTGFRRRLVRYCPIKRRQERKEGRSSFLSSLESVSTGKRRATMPISLKGEGTRRDIETEETTHHLFIEYSSRRASAPCTKIKATVPRTPWAKTVNVARKNARKKAFLMLSFNLLFWLPYCVHATLSSFVEIDYFNFQFACALVVFNAITNILL